MKVLIHLAFNSLGKHRLQLKIAENTFASKNVAIQLNFVYEGTLRGAEKISENNYRNLEIYSYISSP